jgi:predicted ATPase/DNA-binding CsgD family transcriptional regulator
MRESDVDPLIGRSALLAEIADRVARHRLVTLTGPGGTGKTRLAMALVEAARSDREAFFVDLSTVTAGDRFAAVVCASLAVGDDAEPEATLHAWARKGTRLLALDNLEQAHDIADPISRLIGDAPELHVLATSRAPLGVRGEHEVRVPPLALPVDETPVVVEASPACALFLERARAIGRVDLPLDSRLSEEVARLCRRLDGLPLALELAAARTRILSPGAILRHLDERDIGVLRREEGEARHRSLDAVLEWSLELLSGNERRVLEACAICTGTFDLGLLGAIVPDVDILVAVEALVAYNLVVLEEEVDREPRFRLLETVRLAALARLQGREHELRILHARAILGVVEEWAPKTDGVEMRRALVRLDSMRENLEAARGWSSAHDLHLAVSLAGAATPYWRWRNSESHVIDGLQSLLEQTGSASADRARVLGAMSRLLPYNGDPAAIHRIAIEAIEQGRYHTMREVEMEGLWALLTLEGNAESEAGDILLIDERIEAEEPRGPRQRAIVTVWRLTVAIREGGLVLATEAFGAALAEAERSGSPGIAATLAANLALAQLALKRLVAAIHSAAESVRLSSEIGDAVTESMSQGILAVAAIELGRIEQGGNALTRAVALAAALGTSDALSRAFLAAASIAAIQDNPQDAAWLLGAADSAYGQDPINLAEDVVLGARHLRDIKRHSDATQWELRRRDGQSASRQEAIAIALRTSTNGDPSRAPSRLRLRHGDVTPREVEILTLVGEGRSDVEIGNRLFISPKTASVHVANVKAKLGVTSRLEVALRAREMGLVPANPTSPA